MFKMREQIQIPWPFFHFLPLFPERRSELKIHFKTLDSYRIKICSMPKFDVISFVWLREFEFVSSILSQVYKYITSN